MGEIQRGLCQDILHRFCQVNSNRGCDEEVYTEGLRDVDQHVRAMGLVNGLIAHGFQQLPSLPRGVLLRDERVRNIMAEQQAITERDVAKLNDQQSCILYAI